MVVLIILNIILIVILIFLALYIFRNKKDDVKNYYVNKTHHIKSETNKEKKNLKEERVFVGRLITDEEYQQMMKSRKSDIAILLEEVENEYEHLKELNK